MFNSRAPNRQIKDVIFNGQYSLDKKFIGSKLKFVKRNKKRNCGLGWVNIVHAYVAKFHLRDALEA
jgi:hypothetical protein